MGIKSMTAAILKMPEGVAVVGICGAAFLRFVIPPVLRQLNASDAALAADMVLRIAPFGIAAGCIIWRAGQIINLVW